MFNGPLFHEAVISLPRPAASVLQALEARRILGGLNLKEYYPELGDAVLVCATETKTSADMENYATQLGDVIRNS
jgi:glycine dehydrogenase subunit 1